MINSAFLILVIEDSEAKRVSIVDALAKICPGSRTIVALSVSSAIKAIDAQEFDLIVADMSLPTFDIVTSERGGTPRPLGGMEVFAHLEHIDSMTPVVVVSSYTSLGEGESAIKMSEIAKRLEQDYPSLFKGYVYFDSAYTIWEDRFRSVLIKILGE
jgi:CheY-like chemotaxis protein